MAEIYPIGQNRIFYRSQGFTPGLNISVEMLDPELEMGSRDDLDETEHPGLYYFDYVFLLEGTYIGIFYEGDDRIASQAFSTRNLPTDLGSNISGRYKGPNVL